VIVGVGVKVGVTLGVGVIVCVGVTVGVTVELGVIDGVGVGGIPPFTFIIAGVFLVMLFLITLTLYIP
jgi:hypothetical protein